MDLRPAGPQHVHQAGRLRRDVQARSDGDAGEGLLGLEPGADGAEDRHPLGRPLDSLPAEAGQAEVGDVRLESRRSA